MSELVTISFTCSSDNSESFKEKDVPLSNVCNLVGIRNVNVSKSFSHRIQLITKSVVTMIKSEQTGQWHMADANGNYDTKWVVSDHMALENVKLMQGLVIRGTLRDTNYYGNKKYCKQLGSNGDKFFTRDNIPVMTAKLLLLDSRGTVYGRSIK